MEFQFFIRIDIVNSIKVLINGVLTVFRGIFYLKGTLSMSLSIL
jgi:hypothetical protein